MELQTKDRTIEALQKEVAHRRGVLERTAKKDRGQPQKELDASLRRLEQRKATLEIEARLGLDAIGEL